MEQDIPNKIKEFEKIQGEIRGLAFKNISDFVYEKKGAAGIKELEQKMKELNHPLSFNKIKAGNFYPISLLAICLWVAREIFGFSNKDYEDIGRLAAKNYFLIRLYFNYFTSIEQTLKEITKIWRKAATVGDLTVLEFNKEKRRIILSMKGFDLHPYQCSVFVGLFSAATQMIVKNETTCEETKCVHKGDAYHEFLIKW